MKTNQITIEEILEEAKEKFCNCNKLPEMSQKTYGCIYHHLGLKHYLTKTIEQIMKKAVGEKVKHERCDEDIHWNKGYNQKRQELISLAKRLGVEV